jgi:hypothetical protein
LWKGERAEQNLNDRRNIPCPPGLEVKIRIAREKLAKFTDVASQLVGVAVPSVSEKRRGHVIGRISNALVQQPTQLIDRFLGCVGSGSMRNVIMQIIDIGLDDHACDVSDLFALGIDPERSELHERSFEDRMRP